MWTTIVAGLSDSQLVTPLLYAVLVLVIAGMIGVVWLGRPRNDTFEHRICGRSLSPNMPSGIPCKIRRSRLNTWRGVTTVVQPDGTDKDFPSRWFGPVLDADAFDEALDTHNARSKPLVQRAFE